jgi:ribosomal protein S24E
MQILDRKDSKLLGRTEVRVKFAGKSGFLNRKDAIKEVAQALGSSESKVTLIKLAGESGTMDLFGTFHIYESEGTQKELEHNHFAVRLLTKEEKDAIKADKKKAETAAAAAAAAAAPAKKK